MWKGEGRSASCGRLQGKLEPTDIVLSSSNAKELMFYVSKFCFLAERKVEIFCQCNLVK